ncbi:MAG: cell envelope integrity EipB family protein [Xanthobacteraceae bacterium]|nr:cell envelope integrity EipB family protein [Xanthobacteraceae bacterium]
MKLLARGAVTAVLAAATVAAFGSPPVPAQTQGINLVPHRAIYELSLGKVRGKASVQSARGRILYDFTGSACEGYTLDFRQVAELDNGEGKISLSDLRSNTWEDGAGKTYRFTSQNHLNQKLLDAVDGKAERVTGGVAVTLTKPEPRKVDLDAAIVFPTEHVRRIIEAARQGQTILEFPIYDGSETGEKVYNSLTVIGREIGPGERDLGDAASGNDVLAKLRRWPVTVSYFERGKPAGEQTPVYAISFDLYENGISRTLVLDYNDFSISGVLKNIELKDSKPCP